jgi:hypothetical protein
VGYGITDTAGAACACSNVGVYPSRSIDAARRSIVGRRFVMARRE